MLTIEIGKLDEDTECLTVDGYTFVPDWVYTSKPDGKISVGISDEEAAKRLTAYTFLELQKKFQSINLLCDIKLPRAHYLAVVLDFPEGSSAPDIRFQFWIPVNEYAQPWSISDLADKLEESAAARPAVGLKYFEDDQEVLTNGFGLMCQVNDMDAKVDQVVSHWRPIVEQVINQIFAELAAEVPKDSLVTMFKFPSEVAIACEQYLLYFVQFLLDLGIEAHASIKHEAGSVLFSVTPTDGPAALDKIRQALQVYLAIPSEGDFPQTASQYSDISVRQLELNVQHLKYQLAVSATLLQASATLLQAKDAKVEALQLVNYQYRQILGGSVVIDQPTDRSLPAKSDESEAILDGLAKVKPIELHGISLNLPEILRRLKRVFSKK